MSIRSVAPQRLKPFFLDIVQKSFEQLRMGDRDVAEYLATVLTEFSHSDRWLLLRAAQERNLHSAVEMWIETLGPDSAGRRRGEREVRKYIGDYTLFMAGLFRSFVEKRGFLATYLEEGKRAYRAVSELDVSLYQPGYLLFEELSRGFESYTGALDYMRKCFFAPAPGNKQFAGFLRQIEGLVHHGWSRN